MAKRPTTNDLDLDLNPVTEIVLTLRTRLSHPVDGSAIAPDRLAGLDARAIAALPLRSAERPRDPIPLGEVFKVAGGKSDRVRIVGDCALVHGLGRQMAGGELVVDGDAGDEAGLAMRAGALTVTGSAGARLGAALPGASKGMTGGEIVVHGSAGPEAAARIRRGLVFVGGDAGARAGRGMIAGTLVIGGRLGPDAGAFNKRGSIVVLAAPAAGGRAEPAPTGFGGIYRLACTYRPTPLPLILSRLRAAHGAALTDAQIGGLYRRYNGDLGELGKGEVLAWTGA